MSQIKGWILSLVSLVTGVRKLLVFFVVTVIALYLLYLNKVAGPDALITIKEIGIAFVTANVFAKCIDLGKQWIKKRK